MEKMRDIISIPDIKLVIELDDTDNNPDEIKKTFIWTDDVLKSLEIILEKINSLKGCGIFIKGNFGSGKSHFLSFLYLLIRDKEVSNDSILEKYQTIKETKFNILKISLVKYPSLSSLESIILSKFNKEVNVLDRDLIYNEIFSTPTIIIIDELSEFLRSKPTPPSFYEDVRFLQYLGEFSFSNNLWIVASLQEWIEETGHISSSIFNRIKDRYPIRINLTATHIEDIIDKRVVIKNREAEPIIKKVFDELIKFYPKISLDYQKFRKTFPLHPITVRYLSGLTQIFSQNRGVIHFVLSEIKNILEAPYDSLITPDKIYDHFEERIREIPDYSSLARVVFDYYKNNILKILLKEKLASIGLSIIKILILTEISPFEKKKEAKEIAEILLKKISFITDEVNYEYIKDAILEPLVNHKMYINKENNIYFIDPNINEGIKIKGRIKALKEKFQDREYFFQQITSLININYLPLSDIAQSKKYSFNWQNSVREVTAFIAYDQQIKNNDIKKYLEIVGTRIDGYFIICSPFNSDENWIKSLKESFNSLYLGLILFWIPGEFNEEEIVFIEDYLAKNQLVRDFPTIMQELKSRESEFKEIVTKAFFKGTIFYANGLSENNLFDIGYLPFEKLLSYLYEAPLKIAHPYHINIMPKIDYWTQNHIKNLFSSFIRYGKISIEEAEKKGLAPYIKGILEPLQIVKKKGLNYAVSIDVENELASYLLNMLSNEDNIENIRLSLKKGKWGMNEEQANLLILCAVESGFIVPYQGEEIIDIREYSDIIFKVTRVKEGKVLSFDLINYIKKGDFIWGEVEDSPTPITQKEMWKSSTTLIKHSRIVTEQLITYIERYKEYPLIKKINIDFGIINRLKNFFDSITLNVSPPDGIEQILSYIKENNDFKEELNYINLLNNFFDEIFHIINKYYLYILSPDFITNDEINRLKDILIISIDNYLSDFSLDFNKIKEEWEQLYEKYLKSYKDAHREYYINNQYKVIREIENSIEGKILQNISEIVRSAVFENHWLDIVKCLENIPKLCNNDLNSELFINPVCKCGFKIFQKPIDIDLGQIVLDCKNGILNFIKFIQANENREKIESYIFNMPESEDRGDIKKSIFSLLNLDTNNTNLALIYSLLNDKVLFEIENILKGKWTIKELAFEDLLAKIEGRKFRFDDLKNLIFGWLGNDYNSVIWIKSKKDNPDEELKKSLLKYGITGEKTIIRFDTEQGISKERILNEINFANFNINELINFLNIETNSTLKKRLRDEIFYKSLDKNINDDIIKKTDDRVLIDILNFIKIIGEEAKYHSSMRFSNIVSPLNIIYERLKFENLKEEVISYDIFDKIETLVTKEIKNFEKRQDKYSELYGLEELKEKINGPVIVLDGLRFDLWQLLKEPIQNSGSLIYEKLYKIDLPSTTDNFRRSLGIGNDSGFINQKSYIIQKFAEKNLNKKSLNKFLREEADIKFLHFNFIDAKVHSSTINLYPLYMLIKNEFEITILPLLNELNSYYIISDHGFVDNNTLNSRYSHGSNSIWETLLPLVFIKNY